MKRSESNLTTQNPFKIIIIKKKCGKYKTVLYLRDVGCVMETVLQISWESILADLPIFAVLSL
ncbi:MAG: hypothetical protein ACOX79_11700 [Methanosarcina sp.]|mgnify:CR=1 FL=1|jgi:hypothetical protein